MMFDTMMQYHKAGMEEAVVNASIRASQTLEGVDFRSSDDEDDAASTGASKADTATPPETPKPTEADKAISGHRRRWSEAPAFSESDRTVCASGADLRKPRRNLPELARGQRGTSRDMRNAALQRLSSRRALYTSGQQLRSPRSTATGACSIGRVAPENGTIASLKSE